MVVAWTKLNSVTSLLSPHPIAYNMIYLDLTTNVQTHIVDVADDPVGGDDDNTEGEEETNGEEVNVVAGVEGGPVGRAAGGGGN